MIVPAQVAMTEPDYTPRDRGSVEVLDGPPKGRVGYVGAYADDRGREVHVSLADPARVGPVTIPLDHVARTTVRLLWLEELQRRIRQFKGAF